MTDEKEDKPRHGLLRELMAAVPSFASPADVWCAKVALITKHLNADFALVKDVVLTKLPDNIFVKLRHRTFKDADELLAAIKELDQASVVVVSKQLFNQQVQTSATTKPSDIYYELFTQASRILPSANEAILQEVAKGKLLASLPAAAQTVMLANQQNMSIDKLLEILDTLPMSDLPERVNSVKADSNEPVTGQGLENTLLAILSRLEKLETSQQRNEQLNAVKTDSTNRPGRWLRGNGSNRVEDTNWCFYHATFGRTARNCRQPCSFSRDSKN